MLYGEKMKEILDKFGVDKTAYILAMGTTAERGTIDDIGRGLSYKWIKNI